MNEFPSEDLWALLEDRQNELILRLGELNDRIEAALKDLEQGAPAATESRAA